MAATQTDAALGASVGEVRWGIKSGFRRYVSELPDGSITAAGGAYALDDGRYAFPITRISEAEPVVIELSGAVTFEGHGGLLNVRIGELEIEIDGDSILISATGPVDHPRITIARGDGPVHDPAAGVARPLLAPGGVALFGGNYPVGVVLDAVQLLWGDAVK